MHEKDDPTDCDDDSNHDHFRDNVCMTWMISTVYDDDSEIFAQFGGSWRASLDHFALMLGHLGVLEAKMSKSGRFPRFDPTHFGGFWEPIASLFEG